ncbi:tyrosine-type recombinase/integrase [Pontimicrobium sp. MEBiC01747]
MKTFKEYLFQNNYAKTTIQTYTRYANHFIAWCERNNHDLGSIDYKACMQYVKKLQKPSKGKIKSKATINSDVGAIKVFFNYLIDEDLRYTNPMENINIRGIKRSLNHNLLDYNELEDLYYSFQTEHIELPCLPEIAIRNKVIVGLIVYQGLNTTALGSLKVEHIDMNKGTIYVPSTRNTNSRTLELKSLQIMPLIRYLEKDRETIQNNINCHTTTLFPLNSDRFEQVTRQVFKKLKRINHKVKDIKQVRASVITYWLSHFNIREVQYMAGHRYISSTERYVQDDLESLQEIIESLHPIS